MNLPTLIQSLLAAGVVADSGFWSWSAKARIIAWGIGIIVIVGITTAATIISNARKNRRHQKKTASRPTSTTTSTPASTTSVPEAAAPDPASTTTSVPEAVAAPEPKQSSKSKADPPKPKRSVFDDLCTAQGLSDQEKQQLQDGAATLELKNPALLFVDATLLEKLASSGTENAVDFLELADRLFLDDNESTDLEGAMQGVDAELSAGTAR